MRKLICLILLLVCICSLASCTTRQEDESNFTPEPFELIIYEDDGAGYTFHKVLYNKVTNLYYDYQYYYSYIEGSGYRDLERIEFRVYDENGNIVPSEVK